MTSHKKNKDLGNTAMGAKIDLEYMSIRKVRIPNLYWNLEGPLRL